ncbi:protection of telomeres protein 1 isoform X2 [Hippocampus zosterae]|uniref:protection of telomeres protein 1 isoform X2 n=1 Tax=Hippocampus zosterae TaxID=109293 RepID=UPI00223D5C83|nr:protection of telomeres protein 1 isoform X2 [Hippocampus zosterae]
MPVIVLAEGAGPGGHLTIIPIADISADGDHGHHSIKGRVVHKGPLVSSASHGFILKAVIEGTTPDLTLDGGLTDSGLCVGGPPLRSSEDKCGPAEASSINLVLLGMLASDFFQAVNQGDVVTASGFAVGKSPTARKDKRHSCNLLLSGEQAFVRVSRRTPARLASPQRAKKKKTSAPTAVPGAPPCSYVKLADLKPGAVVNVYGVVVFFKQPFKSRGSDLCSILKISDQSGQMVLCNIFSAKLETHPQIFQIGDIVRLRKVKAQLFKGSPMLITTHGFSALTFSGAVGAEVVPRGGRPAPRPLSEEDRRTVTELRSWAAGRDLLPPDPSVSLAHVQPRSYFNLACQLLAKATVDSTCTLLRVWDGTRCPHALLNVTADWDEAEGPTSFGEEQEKLIVNVLVYDEHAQSAQQLKPGDFVKIFNLRAMVASDKTPGRSERLSFHLHGGTAYCRGVRRLPDDSADLRELIRVMQAFRESHEGARPQPHDSAVREIRSTPPKSPGGGASVEVSTERSCHHDVGAVTLGELTRGEPPPAAGVHHVRAQLRSYEPHRLHRALKLYCSQCTSMQDVPNDKHVASVFAEAYTTELGTPPDHPPPPPSSISGQVYLPGYHLAEGPPARVLAIHLSERLAFLGRAKELIFLAGSSLQEARHLAGAYRNVVPVRSAPGCHPTLLDLSAPFLFRGKRSFYGCKRCSKGAAIRELTIDKDAVMDEKVIAEAFGVQLLKLVLLLKFRLQDASDELDVFLWRDAESFFDVSADDAATNQEAQDRIRRTLDSLCPPKGAGGERPWMDLCLAAYRVDDVENRQTCYQICHTSVKKALSQKHTSQ